MAPFRNRDRSNRSGRGQIEHNVLEGLPINQYREVEITVGANAADDKPADKDAWPELPMPRDSHMLPEHSQQLLRAARSGRIHKPPAPPEDDNEMKDEEEENKEIQTGFTIKKYIKVARHLELSEPEYLAKRRKGLPSPYVMNGLVQPAVRETKVKRLDAEGNATVYKVLVPEGQAVEGEVQPTDAAIEAAPATAAPGTIVEGVGVVNAEGVVVANDILQQTPPRRRQPPPKKKRGGPGRGKKRVVFAEGAAEQGTSTTVTGSDLLPIPGVKTEGGSVEPSDGDTPMAEAGGEDEEGSGEEGSEDEEHDGENAMAPTTLATPLGSIAAPTSVPNLDAPELASLEAATPPVPPVAALEEVSQPTAPSDVLVSQAPMLETAESGAMRDASSSPDLPLSTVSHSRQNSLNQIPTSAVTEPEPMSLDPVEATIEPVNEVVAEVAAEPIVEPAVEPTIEPIIEPIIEPTTESTIVSTIESIAEPKIEPTIESTAESAVEPTGEPLAQPIVEPVIEARTELVMDPVPAIEQAQQSTVVEAIKADAAPASLPEHASAPPSEPDLMGSLERHLENNSENAENS